MKIKPTEPFMALIITLLILMPTYFLDDKVFQGALDLAKLSVGAYWGYTRQDGKDEKE